MARVAMAACVIGLLLARSPGVAATWDSAGQFSGTQGQSDWFYQYGSAPLRDDNLTFDASAGTWKHPTIAYLWLWAIGGHPGPTLAAARNWRSPFIGSANVSVDLSDADPNCGDGIVASIYRNSLLVWGPTTMANGGSLTPFTLPHVPVERGDLLSFRIDSGAANNNACDATTFRVTLDGSPNRWAAPGPEGITGTIEQATATVVSGWAADRDANGNPITVHIYVDGTFRAFLTANQPRQDLVDAGLTTEPNHGFTWTPSPPLDGNLHAVAVYAINVGGGAAGVPLVGSPSAVNPLPVSLDPPREVLGPQTNGLINFPDAPVGTITWKGVKHRYLGEGHNLNSWQAIEQADGSWVVQTTPTLTQGTTTFDDGVWLYDVVNGGTRVRGWYSAEEYRDHSRSPCVYACTGCPCLYTTRWSIAYAESKNGDTFAKGGNGWGCPSTTKYPNNQVITSRVPSVLYTTTGSAGAGLPRVIQVGDFYYMYYTDLSATDSDPNSTVDPAVSDGKSGLHVARAPVATYGCPGTWLKWKAGAFVTPGIGGDSDSVIPDGVPDSYAGTPSISWNSALNRYVMITAGRGGFYMRTSVSVDANGIHWDQSPPQQIMGGPEAATSSGQPGEEFLAYPTLLSTTGDVQTTGATAWLYYVLKRAPDQLTSRTVVRRLVRF
ncbi:MAG: hypothetical protein E6J69_16700 [Deltaproteobacteria bacterium]|nr:MAG: hypothetical protein E6J69_16700 [Deltaproteobacteria bacterium]